MLIIHFKLNLYFASILKRICPFLTEEKHARSCSINSIKHEHSCKILYISFYRSSSTIKVGEWHRALIQTVYKDGSLELDKGIPVTDSSQVPHNIYLEQPSSKWYTYLELQ